jgi:hypothetical protein
MPSISVGPQFIHLDCFSRNRPKNTKQWTTQDIIHELIRTPDNSKHVKEPEAPVILDGMHPRELEKEIEAILKNGRDGGGRKLRKDAKIFIGSVASYPVPVADLNTREKRDAYFQWEQDTVQFYEEFFGGENVRSVVKHLDEGFVHLHAVVMPHLHENSQFDFDSVHPGHKARREYRALCARDKLEPTKRQIDKVVAEALESFQDSYYQEVGQKNALSRFGSRGKPLSYHQWKKQNKKRGKAPTFIVDALRHNPLFAPEYIRLKRQAEDHAAVSAAFEEISATAGVPPADPAAVTAAVAEIARARGPGGGGGPARGGGPAGKVPPRKGHSDRRRATG